MKRFEIHCVERQTGSEHLIEVEAPDEFSARHWAAEQGYMVGLVKDLSVPMMPGVPSVSTASSPVTSQHAPSPDRESMIKAARVFQQQSRDQQAIASTSAPELRDIADALKRVAESPLISRPRRTLLLCVVAGMFLGGGLTSVLTVLIQATMMPRLGGLSGATLTGGSIEAGGMTVPLPAGGAGTTVSPQQLEGAVKVIEDYKKLLDSAGKL